MGVGVVPEDDALKHLTVRVERLEYIVTGNGVEGLDEVVRTNSRTLALLAPTVNKIDETVDAIRSERKEDAAEVRGRLSVVRWAQWGVMLFAAIIGILGSVGLVRVDYRFAQVQQQLQSIPSVPE